MKFPLHFPVSAAVWLGAAMVPAVAQTIPAFPGAEGFGAYAKGGRGGDVYRVTNLNGSGAGSLAEGIATAPSAGRTIVFAVSGWIPVPSSNLRITQSKITIAGQTAPGDGVGLRNGTFRISGDDIVIRHLRFRHGKNGSGGDCIDLDSGSVNSILDSCSLQFSTDENISSFSSPPENLTMQWSLNAWGLESHSCGGLWDQNHATCHHTLWAHNHTRNPKARPGGLLEWINNVTFDWDIGFIMGDSQTPAAWKANVIGSYFVCPPGNLRSKALEKASLDRNGNPNFSLWLSNCRHDNNGDGLLNGTDKGHGIVSGTYTTLSAPVANTGALPVTVDDPTVAFKKVVSKAGALRLDVNHTGPLRDEVDTKLIDNLVTQTRQHITRESDLGVSNAGFGTLASASAPPDADKDGMPDYYETALGWNPAVADHNTALASSGGVITGATFLPPNSPAGHTRLEEYLHFLAIPHALVPRNTTSAPTSQLVDLRRYTAGFSQSPVFTVAAVSGGTVAQSGPGGALATFTPTVNFTGRGRFDFTVTDAAGHSWTQTVALLVSASGVPRDLTWKGDGTANAWDTTAANWLAKGSATAFATGDRVTFDDAGSRSPAVAVNATVTPGDVTVDTAAAYSFAGSGAITSVGELTKRGAGSLTLGNAGANAFGAVTLEAGTLTLGNNNSLGGAPVRLLGGTLAIGSTAPTSSALTVAGATTISGGNGGGSTGIGTVTGSAPLTIAQNNVFDLRGDMSGYSGTVTLSGNALVRLNGSTGSASATFHLAGTSGLAKRSNAGTITLGGLSGLAGTTLSGATGGGNTTVTTYVVGDNGASTTFAGAIQNGQGTTSLTKVGGGALTLTGTSTHTGATLVSAGSLYVNGTLSTSPVTVAASLRGHGTLGGGVTAQSGSRLSPGATSGGIGTLTIGGGLTLQGGATLSYQLTSDPFGTNDRIVLNGGALTLTGSNPIAIQMTDGYLAEGVYTLVEGAASTVGTVANLSHSLPAAGRQSYALSVTGGKILLTVTGRAATLLWKGNVGSAWDLAITANWLNGGVASTFYDFDAVQFDDAATTTAVTLAAAVQPRLVTFANANKAYTLGGSPLSGGAVVVKGGAATVNLTAANAHTGGTVINEGSVQLANETANTGGLGTGPVTLAGGTLAMYRDSASYSATTLDIVVPAGRTGRLRCDDRVDLSGTLTGGGTLELEIPWVRTTLFGDWSAFTGVIDVSGDADGGDLRMGTSYNFPGFPRALVALGARMTCVHTGTTSGGAGTTVEIGALSGVATAKLLGGATPGRAFTYRIGGRGDSTTFAGSVAEQDSGVATALVKTGAGTWTLAGACTHGGSTTVEQGTLCLSGTLTNDSPVLVLPGATLCLQNGTLTVDSVNVASGASMTGAGTLAGELNNDGTVNVPSGLLRVRGSVVNNGLMRFTGGAALDATGGFVNNGTLDLLAGVQQLPSIFENNGVVIDSSHARVSTVARTAGSVTLSVDSVPGYSYQLERSPSLATTDWQNVGAAKSGTGSALTFTDAAASGVASYYRVVMTAQ